MNDAKVAMNEANAKAPVLIKGSATAAEACKLFERYEGAELKLLRFVEANSETCNFSNEYSEKLKQHYEATLRRKPKTCLWRLGSVNW
jgi:hypothetical protein